MLRSIRVRNVREAYPVGLGMLLEHGEQQDSRNGPVLALDGPMITTYTHPWERVILDPARDANPFFHLLESFWMLAGMRDVASISQYAGQLKTYSDDGETFWGAYGHRWRHHFGEKYVTHEDDGIVHTHPIDQLVVAIKELRANPSSRRVVISMWDPVADLGRDGLDLPCNTQIYLRVLADRLDMTLMCRSNDAIWGAYGANAVHFSVLHEFLAAMIGVRQGELHQLSNNFHVYTSVLDQKHPGRQIIAQTEPYTGARPLFTCSDLTEMDPRVILSELTALWQDDEDVTVEWLPVETVELFQQMRHAWRDWKRGDYGHCLREIEAMPHPDWRLACTEWLQRRVNRANSR